MWIPGTKRRGREGRKEGGEGGGRGGRREPLERTETGAGELAARAPEGEL